jgi:uncharacterized Tic20 family protein
MSALAHASVILFGMGIVASIVIYATQKEESRYTAFQALQATVYQIIGFTVYLIGICCWLGIYLASMIPLIAADLQGSSEPPLVFLFSMALMVVPFAFMGLWTVGGLWAAVRCLQGRGFQYPVIGHQLERWLAAD